MAILLLGIHNRPSGRKGYTMSFESDTWKDKESAFDYAINKSRFSYSCGKKVYYKNIEAESYINAGNYEFTL